MEDNVVWNESIPVEAVSHSITDEEEKGTTNQRKRPRENDKTSSDLKSPKQEKLDSDLESTDDHNESHESLSLKDDFENLRLSSAARCDELNISDLVNVIDLLKQGKFTNSKWSTLGLYIGLLQPTLNEIESNYRDNVERCLQECLTQWLYQADIVCESGGPTLDSLAVALKKIGENVAAEEIKEFRKLSMSAREILERHCDRFSQIILPVTIVQMLYTENVITMEMSNAVNTLGSVLRGSPLKALCHAVSKDPEKLRLLASILQKSDETVLIGEDMLKEYNQKHRHLRINLQPYLQYDFDQMKVAFGNLIEAVAPLINTGIPSSEDLKKYLGRCFRDLKPKLAIAKTFDAIMEAIQDRCSIINVDCLEAVVKHYNINEARPHISAFKLRVDDFCKQVKVDVCCSQSFSVSSLSRHLICETIEFVVDWEVDKYTLNDIRGLLSEAFKDVAKSVHVTAVNETNSITVTCCAPQHMMDILLIVAEKNLDQLKAIGLIKLKVGYYVLFDKSKADEETGVLVEDKQKNEDLLRQKIESQNVTIEEMAKTFQDMDSQLKTLQGELDKLRQVVLQLSSATKEKDSELEIYKKMNNAMIQQIEDLKKSRNEKEDLLSDKQTEIDTQQDVITTLCLQLKDKHINDSKDKLNDLPTITRPRETTSYDQKSGTPTKSTQEEDHTAPTSVNNKVPGMFNEQSNGSMDADPMSWEALKR